MQGEVLVKVYLRPINPADLKMLSLTYPGAPSGCMFGSCSGHSKGLETPVLVSAGRLPENLTFPAVLGGEVR